MARHAIVVVAAAGLAGCVMQPVLPVPESTAQPDPNVGYVYGALLMLKNKNDNHLRIGLALKQVGGEREYVMDLSRTQPVLVYPVQPGRYAVNKVVYMHADGEEVSRKDLPPLLTGVVEVRPGMAVYIGHYEGQTWVTDGRMWQGTWHLDKWCRDFKPSSDRFSHDWPNLSGLPKVDGTSGGPFCQR